HHAGAPIEPDGNILTRRRYDSVVASEAADRSLKARLGGIVRSATVDESRRTQQSQYDDCVASPFAHYQPSFSRPSNQSHKKKNTTVICRPAVLLTGTRTPRLARMCCLRLIVTCICGTTSQFIFALSTKSLAPTNSNIGDHSRPNPRFAAKLCPTAVLKNINCGAMSV